MRTSPDARFLTKARRARWPNRRRIMPKCQSGNDGVDANTDAARMFSDAFIYTTTAGMPKHAMCQRFQFCLSQSDAASKNEFLNLKIALNTPAFSTFIWAAA